MEHYYSPKPSSKHNKKIINYKIDGVNYNFQTDAGVFSRKNVDFGTKLLLSSVLKHEDLQHEVIDMGCGYGIIGIIIASKNPNSKVHLVDINERSVKLTLDNANLNNIKNIFVYQSNLFADLNLNNKVEVIISNPPVRAGKNTVWKLIEEAHDTLVLNGRLWIVVKKNHGANSVAKKLETLFAKVNILDKQSGYFIFCATK